jgi:aminoglycoside phosphotransferase (APT) family kinase protein
MEREHRIISALAGTAVPVPSAVGLCTDVSVDGAPFYVMDHVDGLVLRDQAAVDAVGVATRRRAGLAMAETLAAIHRIDPHEVGLGDLGREEGYVARQLRRWNGQFLSSGGHDRSVVEAFERLSVAVPEQGAAALVHGDYRLDNCMIDDAGEILAVLDWELCTLGDPLADLGLMLVYWTEPTDGFCAHPAGPTTVADGFPDRAEIVAAYTAAGGRPPDQLEYYVALGFWKLACILQGVATRYDAGAMGDDGARAETFGAMVTTLGTAALATLDSIGTPTPWTRHL